MWRSLEEARAVADAIMYEGYLLYPYRASATKNQMRWQFGVLVPPGFTATAEPSASRTECLVEGPAEARLGLCLRFLHVRSRTVEQAVGDRYQPVPKLVVGDRTYLSFDDATARDARAGLRLSDAMDAEHAFYIDVPRARTIEQIPEARHLARTTLEHLPLQITVRVRAVRLPGPYGLIRLHVGVHNTARWDQSDAPREQALRRSLIGTHVLIGLTGARFVSLLDPPEWARDAAAGCRNEHTWPVLVGDPRKRDVLLSAPIILYDYPAIAPESPGELFDSTEIDELLGLRTLSLTDEEREEAQATDPRAAEIIRRVTDLSAHVFGRLHGAIRQLQAVADTRTSAGRRPAAETEPGLMTDADRDRRADEDTAESGPTRDPGPPGGADPGTDSRAAGARHDAEADAVSPVPSRARAAGAGVVTGTEPDGSPAAGGVLVGGVRVSKGSRVVLRPGRRQADAQDMFLAGRTAVVEAVLLDVDGVRYLAVTLENDPGADLHRAHGRFRYFAPDEVEPVVVAGDSGSGGQGSGGQGSRANSSDRDGSDPDDPGRERGGGVLSD
jgi:hypothetical protein